MVNIYSRDTDSRASGYYCSSLACAPSTRAAACQTSQASKEVVQHCEGFLCTKLRAQRSDSGGISSWLTSLSSGSE
jgi:hypothetical protein